MLQPQRPPAVGREGEERVAGEDLGVVAQEGRQLQQLLAGQPVVLPGAAPAPDGRNRESRVLAP